MSSDQHFCLKWNNHQDTLISLFSSLLDSNTFVDCTLAAGGKQIKAHKMILSACSPYFKEILLEYGDTHPIIILNNVQFPELLAIVEFMYRGEVNVAQEQLPLFLKAATALQVKGLTDNKSDSGTSEDGGRDDDEDDDDEEGYTSEVSSTGATPRSRGGGLNDSANMKLETSLGLHDITTGTSADESQGPGPSNDFYDHDTKQSMYERNSSFLGLLQQQNFYKYGDDNLSPLTGLPVGNSTLAAAYGKMIQLRRPNATEKDASFKCEVCAKFYRSKTSLNLHKRWECGKEPKFACPYCDKRCHQKGNLKVHIISRHRDRLSQQPQTQSQVN
ncbi:hypothetical protein O3M35_011186 [Rhynocoris fuscipes]|uniref:Longitudinals lacking protein n=1 Tax=Rhynocoris fuscipes TaxID=488301 RepID=A0AAW1CX73_9HEMI